MRLYFLRHGIADWPDWDPARDHERPLTKDGMKKMKAQAKTAGRPWREVRCDPLQSLHPRLSNRRYRGGKIGPGSEDRAAAGARLQPRQVGARSPRRYADDQALLLVGHEPSFSTVIAEFIGGGRVQMKKGALARVDVNSELQGELVWLLQPKILTPVGHHGNLLNHSLTAIRPPIRSQPPDRRSDASPDFAGRAHERQQQRFTAVVVHRDQRSRQVAGVGQDRRLRAASGRRSVRRRDRLRSQVLSRRIRFGAHGAEHDAGGVERRHRLVHRLDAPRGRLQSGAGRATANCACSTSSRSAIRCPSSKAFRQRRNAGASRWMRS